MKIGTERKLRYGGATAAMISAIIVAVILVNVVVTVLIQGKALYIDLTPELEFTLSDECIDLFKEGDKNFEESSSPIKKIDEIRAEHLAEEKAAFLAENGREMTEAEEKERAAAIKEDTKIVITFCDIQASWSADDSAMKHVWKTAVDLKNKFDDYIAIKYVDIIREPTAVVKYGSKSINQQTVIVSCENESRVIGLKSFYIFDSSDSETPWAYSGEKTFASAVLAVTRASAPIALFTTGHNEKIASEAFLTTLMHAGYEYGTIDLATEDIPANCRLLIISSPDRDFAVPDGTVSDIDEIEKIEEFLDKGSSLMVFMSPDLTTPLYNLEEYLHEWGISFDRYTEDGDDMVYPYRIRESANNSVSRDNVAEGENFLAKYVTFGLGNNITKQLIQDKRKIVFTQATSISYYAPVTGFPIGYTEEEDGSGEVLGDYCRWAVDGKVREMFPVFVTSGEAEAYAAGKRRETAANGNLFNLMTISVEDRFISEDDIAHSFSDNSSYVVASGCPNFITSENMLSVAYGNVEFLESTLRTIGHEPVPTKLTFRPIGDFEIDTVTDSAVLWNTILFTAIPAVIALVSGVVVIVRRKNR